jgi:methyl-accepting chemotaxis protein
MAIYKSSRMTMLGIVFGGVIAGTILAFAIGRVVSRPLAKSVEVLGFVAKGDFTQTLDVNTKDEVGQMAQALNQAVGGVRDALNEVRIVSEGLASASQQLSAASQEISSGAQEQASNLEETASSLEEITSTVKQNADNAQQANQLASRSREVAEKGGQVVHNAVAGMGEINKASKQIADIITAIDEIAFQTNLLALNAAVEAARAGEQGRGFAVVAGEVRNLAQRSAGAAKEIKGLIQDSVRKVEAGSDLVNQSGETLQEIVTSVKRVTDIVGEIAAASREQSTGIDQVSKAVAQMDQVTQTNASQTEELSGTAESLAGQAHQLQELVARFKLDAEGATSKRPAVGFKAPVKAGDKRKPKAAASSRSQEPTSFGTGDGNDLDLVAAGVADGNDGFAEF